MDPARHYELFCPGCGWSRSCGAAAMLEVLRAVQMLRTGAAPDLELLPELFAVAAAKTTCPDCGRLGLSGSEEQPNDADWPGARPCADCGGPIGRERLLALPHSTRCAGCEQAAEQGKSSGPAEYCSRCGSVLELKPTRGPGLTRYAMVCPACRR